jgi:hypothetical protein
MRVGRPLLFAITLTVAACANSPSPPPPPSQEAALAYLDTVVTLVASGDAAAICSVGSATCEQILRMSDPASVPRSAPVVIGSRVADPTRLADGTVLQGGRVLELCGLDGLDHAYHSEMLVFEIDGRLISTATPYWLGFGIADTPLAGGPALDAACP